MDKLQEPDLKIIKALYDNWKTTNKNELSFNAPSCSLQNVLKQAGISDSAGQSHLESLQAFDFIEFDEDNIKLLPSGIKYARGQFDNIH
jgi:hypothetical protein